MKEDELPHKDGQTLSELDQMVVHSQPSTSAVVAERSDKISKEPPAEVLSLLKKYFGHKSFRPLQWTIIKNVLNGKDQVVVMSTGNSCLLAVK